MSHTNFENHTQYASHYVPEAQALRASQDTSGTQMGDASQCVSENHTNGASQEGSETQGRYASHLPTEAHHKSASHSNPENHRRGASHQKCEAHRCTASHHRVGTQRPSASQDTHETHKGNASQDSGEVHAIGASHSEPETQNEIASHAQNEVHEIIASHALNEAHRSIASHLKSEPQSCAASHHEVEAQANHASHSHSETQNEIASHLPTEAHHKSASQSESKSQNNAASQGSHENQELTASQRVSENHTNGASHNPAENQSDGASQPTTEAQSTSAEEWEEEHERRGKAWEKRMRLSFPRMKYPRLRILVESYYDMQKLRIATANRLRTYEKFNMVTPIQAATIQGVISDLKLEEEKYEKLVADEVKSIPIFAWLKGVKGIGPMMAAGLIAWIGCVWMYKCSACGHTWKLGKEDKDDPKECPKCGVELPEPVPHIGGIECFNNVSKLWAYAVGKPGERRERGKKVDHNPRLGMHCWKVGMQILKAHSKKRGVHGMYPDFYDKSKQEYLTREDIKAMHDSGKARGGKKSYKIHIHQMALRKMIKLFLSHLWEAWRKAENLPVREPYAVEVLGHEKIEG